LWIGQFSFSAAWLGHVGRTKASIMLPKPLCLPSIWLSYGALYHLILAFDLFSQ
jgi:hypothetical protein